MGKLKVAVATKGSRGLRDEVSDVFGRAQTFTVVEVEGDRVKNVEILDNPAASYEYGAGPIVVKMLADKKVKVVIAGEFGPGVSVLLTDKGIHMAKVKAWTNVSQAVNIIK